MALQIFTHFALIQCTTFHILHPIVLDIKLSAAWLTQRWFLIYIAGDQQPATCLNTMRPFSGCVLFNKDVNAVDQYVQVGTETSICTRIYL